MGKVKKKLRTTWFPLWILVSFMWDVINSSLKIYAVEQVKLVLHCAFQSIRESASCRLLFCFYDNQSVLLSLLSILHTEKLTFMAATVINSLFCRLIFYHHSRWWVHFYPVFQCGAALHLRLVPRFGSIDAQMHELPDRGVRGDA